MIASAEIASAHVASCEACDRSPARSPRRSPPRRDSPAVFRGGVQHGFGHHALFPAGLRPQFDEEDVLPLHFLQRRFAVARLGQQRTDLVQCERFLEFPLDRCPARQVDPEVRLPPEDLDVPMMPRISNTAENMKA